MRGKDTGDATWNVSKRSRRCPYCQSVREELFPEPEESRGNLLQYSRHFRGVQLKKQVQGEELTLSKKDLLPKLLF